MNTSDMWSVWDTEDDERPLCFCVSSDDAYLVQERITQIDTEVLAPGKTLKDKS